MRHRLHHKKLNRTMEHRKALRRNMAQSLLEHSQIRTTLTKAKDLRPFVERIITLAIKVRKAGENGDRSVSLSARRRIHGLLSERSIVPEAHRDDYDAMSDAHREHSLRMRSGRRFRTGEPKGRLAFTGESVTYRLIEKVAARYMDRPGGYTRIVRLPDRRIGDASELAILQLVGGEEEPGAVTKPGKTSRRRKADARYAFAVSTSKIRKDSSTKSKKKEDEPGAEEPIETDESTAPEPEASTDSDEADSKEE